MDGWWWTLNFLPTAGLLVGIVYGTLRWTPRRAVARSIWLVALGWLLTVAHAWYRTVAPEHDWADPAGPPTWLSTVTNIAATIAAVLLTRVGDSRAREDEDDDQDR